MVLLVTLCLTAVVMIQYVEGHAKLVDPPSRNDMHRLGFDNPVNDDSHGLNCGGYKYQWTTYNGQCGVCGDAYGVKPAQHEAGGKYANGIIGKTYARGSKMDVRVQITANHKGYYEFKICPNNNYRKTVSQRCLDRYPLADSEGNTRFYLPPGYDDFTATLQLPQGLTCTQCVVQWTWTAGNNVDTGGKQETFRNCADVAIVSEGDFRTSITASTPTPHPTNNHRKLEGNWDCEVLPPYNQDGGVATYLPWCIDNCIKALPAFRKCPASYCHCFRTDGGRERITHRHTTDPTPRQRKKTTPVIEGNSMTCTGLHRSMDNFCSTSCEEILPTTPTFCPEHCKCKPNNSDANVIRAEPTVYTPRRQRNRSRRQRRRQSRHHHRG